MEKVYTFLIGLSLGLLAAFVPFGKFWLGVLAGMPLGCIVLALVIVVIAALAEHFPDDEHYGVSQ